MRGRGHDPGHHAVTSLQLCQCHVRARTLTLAYVCMQATSPALPSVTLLRGSTVADGSRRVTESELRSAFEALRRVLTGAFATDPLSMWDATHDDTDMQYLKGAAGLPDGQRQGTQKTGTGGQTHAQA